MQCDNSREVLLVLVTIIVILCSGCRSREDDKMVRFGPNEKADLVIFFKADATDQEIYKFSNETVAIPTERGSWPLAGISLTLSLLPIDGYKGYAISFFPEATEGQREYVKSRVKSSPIVYRVMENVIPSEIKDVDGTPPSNNGMQRTRN